MSLLKRAAGAVMLVTSFWATNYANASMTKDIVKQLRGHKAAYSFDLTKRKSGSEVVGAEGIMSLRMDISCDTAAMSQVLLLQYDMSEGSQMLYEESINSVENYLSKDFSFVNKVKVNGNVTHDVKGNARNIDQKSAIINRKTADNDEIEFTSKKAIEFPVEQLANILNAIQNGDERYSSRLFDGGNGAEKLYDVIVTSFGQDSIPDDIWPDEANIAEPDQLRKLQFSYFGVAEGDVFEPESVLTALMTDDGIAVYFDIDFDNYSLAGQLLSLEAFEQPKCN